MQGSGVGPTLFVILTLGLNTLSGTNELIKFADDTTLLSLIHTAHVHARGRPLTHVAAVARNNAKLC